MHVSIKYFEIMQIKTGFLYLWKYIYSINQLSCVRWRIFHTIEFVNNLYLCQFFWSKVVHVSNANLIIQLSCDTETLISVFHPMGQPWQLVSQGELRCGLKGTRGTSGLTALMQVIVLPLTDRYRQRLSRELYQKWPILAGKGCEFGVNGLP